MLLLKSETRSELRMGLFSGGGGLIIGMIFVLRIRGGGLFSGGGAYYRGFTVYIYIYIYILHVLY